MAILVRNLLIYFIICFAFFIAGLIYHLETRLMQKDYSDLLKDIDKGIVSEVVILQDIVEVTTRSGNRYTTVVQEPAYLATSWHSSNIRISYRKDYSTFVFFGTSLVFLTSLFLVSWLFAEVSAICQNVDYSFYHTGRKQAPVLSFLH